LARWVETLAEFDIEVVHRAGRLHINVDDDSSHFCKQSGRKTLKTCSVDEFERDDELAKPLAAHTVEVAQNEMGVPTQVPI